MCVVFIEVSGSIVAGAHLTITSGSGEPARSTTTDNQGRYSFGDLPAATYALRVESPGFQTASIQSLSVGGGREATQNVTLTVGSATQTVTVTAQQPTVETSSAELAGASSANVGSGAALGGTGTRGGLAGGRLLARGVLTPPPADSGEISQARQQMTSAAEGTDLGDLFQYKLKDLVTIHKNESALVPILQAHVRVEKVSLWNASAGSLRPLHALWITNSNPLTLDGGSFSVLEDETFAGEGLTDSIKPSEKRLLSYAVDLGVRVDRKIEGIPQRVTHVRITRGVMVQTSEMRQTTTYTIRNDDTTSRVVLIEHPLRTGWTIADNGPQPEETTSNLDRFRVSLNPKATQTLELRESQPIETRIALMNLTNDQIGLFLQQKSITPGVEAAFRKIVQQKSQVDSLDAEVSRRDEETRKIFDDQQRLRENLKALKGSPEERALTQRYTHQLADQETRLGTLKQESADLQTKSDEAQKDLNDLIQNLDLDATL
jgi:hypothetical protein